MNSPWMGQQATAEYLGVTTMSIRRWEAKGILKGYKLEGKRYYHRDELDALILGSKNPPVTAGGLGKDPAATGTQEKEATNARN